MWKDCPQENQEEEEFPLGETVERIEEKTQIRRDGSHKRERLETGSLAPGRRPMGWNSWKLQSHIFSSLYGRTF